MKTSPLSTVDNANDIVSGTYTLVGNSTEFEIRFIVMQLKKDSITFNHDWISYYSPLDITRNDGFLGFFYVVVFFFFFFFFFFFCVLFEMKMFYLINHILSETICPFCFCVLVSNMYP